MDHALTFATTSAPDGGALWITLLVLLILGALAALILLKISKSSAPQQTDTARLADEYDIVE